MATFPLHRRHSHERALSDKIQKKLRLEIYDEPDEPTGARSAGGDHRYRLPTIGLNAGAMPGTSPHKVG